MATTYIHKKTGQDVTAQINALPVYLRSGFIEQTYQIEEPVPVAIRNVGAGAPSPSYPAYPTPIVDTVAPPLKPPPNPLDFLTIGGTRTDPVITTFNGTPNIPNTQENGIKGAVTGILDDLLNTAKTTGESILRGALEGGRAASSGAAQGAQVGAGISGMNLTVILGVSVVVLVLLLRGK